eukprot:6498110-Prymnesium_polylepis.1
MYDLLVPTCHVWAKALARPPPLGTPDNRKTRAIASPPSARLSGPTGIAGARRGSRAVLAAGCTARPPPPPGAPAQA